MDGASVEHGHDLTYKVFGEEISIWQNFCADQLHHLVDKTQTHAHKRIHTRAHVIKHLRCKSFSINLEEKS